MNCCANKIMCGLPMAIDKRGFSVVVVEIVRLLLELKVSFITKILKQN